MLPKMCDQSILTRDKKHLMASKARSHVPKSLDTTMVQYCLLSRTHLDFVVVEALRAVHTYEIAYISM